MILISVTEKLPQITDNLEDKMYGLSDRVLVVEGGRYYFGYYQAEIGEWILEGLKGNLSVTHWMPLPDPSKFIL